jgi:hypothetical protein
MMDVQENRKEHMLKTDPAVFQDVLDGSKTFEIRFNDRGYQVDDLIVLKETKFTGQQMKSGQPLVYTGREIQKRISYVLSGYGLQEDWVILGIQDIEAAKAQAVPDVQQALNDRLLVRSIKEQVESHIAEISVNDLFDKGWFAAMKCIQSNIDMLEAREPTND